MATPWGTHPWLPNEQPPYSTPKRLRANSGDSTGSLQHEDYTVGWISALPLEMTAAEVMLDHEHQSLPQDPQDSNCYKLGSIGGNNVVIACLPKGHYGTNNAATVANDMARSFPCIQHRVMVGIGGGVPEIVDVRLGDVVVSTEVVQYDLGKATPNSQFQRIAHPVRPPHSLMTVVSKLQASHERGQNGMLAILHESIARLRHYAHPMLPDRLFLHNYDHAASSPSCDFCDQSQVFTRSTRQSTDPVVHYGRIASGNQVIKDGSTRERISNELDNICFEMEAAGFVDSSPCLVIRGICDYSDSHKNKKWQEYAAIVAAAYAKELIQTIPVQALQTWKRRRTQKRPATDFVDPDADRCLREIFITDSVQDLEDILDAKGDICQGTCGWVLSTKEFKTWHETPPHLLWISAPPGMGKTYLSIYLINHFQRISMQQPNTTTLFFLCDNKLGTRNTATNILRGLIHQLITSQGDLIDIIIPQWRQEPSQLLNGQSFGTLWRLFEEMIKSSNSSSIYCVIDALDECESSSLAALLRKLERLSKGTIESLSKIKLVCLSRRFPEQIEQSLMLFKRIEIDRMRERQDDIRQFISERVHDLTRKKNLSSMMRNRLSEIFQERSEGTFLWVSFMAQGLEKQRTLDFEDTLEMLPRGLDGIYDRILSQIDFDRRDIIWKLLNWILIATRPLSILELCEAIEVKPTQLLTREEVLLELIASCGHLLQIFWGESYYKSDSETESETDPDSDTKGEPSDEQSLTESSLADVLPNYRAAKVTFVHQSAKDHLINRNQNSILQLNEYATNQLLHYLHRISCHVKEFFESKYELLQRFPLAHYALNKWWCHLKEFGDVSPIIQQNGHFFIENSETRTMWIQLTNIMGSVSADEAPRLSVLHMSCMIGLDILTKWCLRQEGKTSLDRGYEWQGRTPLHEACYRRHEVIAVLLLEAGADALAKSYGDETAFEVAVQFCSSDLVRRMTQQEPCRQWLRQNTSQMDPSLLSGAARRGNEASCRFLVEELGWSVDWVVEYGVSPGHLALCSGHIELARIFFIEWNARINHWVSLYLACNYLRTEKSKAMMEFLVHDCSVNINAPNAVGDGILHTIIDKHLRWDSPKHLIWSISMVLELGCNPERHNSRGQTALHCAAMNAHLILSAYLVHIINLLVPYGRHGINQVCFDQQTVLHYFTQTFFSLDDDWFIYKYIQLAPQSLKGLLDMGIDRHLRNINGYCALDLLRPALDPDKQKWKKHRKRYEKAAKEMMVLLEDYSTVPTH